MRPDAGRGRAPGAPGSTRLLRPRARPCHVRPWTGPRGWPCAPCLAGCQTVPRRCPPDPVCLGDGGVSARPGAAPGTGARASARPPRARGPQGGGPGVGVSADVVSTVRGPHVLRGPDVGRRFVVTVWSRPHEVAAAAGAPGTRASVRRKASTKAQPRCEARALWAPLSGKSRETGTRHVGGSSFPRHSRVLGLVLPPPGWPPARCWGLFLAGCDARCALRLCLSTLPPGRAALPRCASAAGCGHETAARGVCP